MTTIVPLTDSSDWHPAFRRRHLAAGRAAGVPAAAAEQLADSVVDPAHGWTAAAITDREGRRVGQVVVGVIERGGRSIGRIVDLWTEPSATEHRPAALAWARQWCEEHGVGRVAVRLAEPDAVFDAYPVRSQTRFKAIGAAARPGGGVTARPMTEAEYPDWVGQEYLWYAEDIARSGSLPPQDALKKAEKEYQVLLPEGLATKDTSILVLEAAGTEVGVLWLRHDYLPGVSYLYSVAVHQEHRGRGYGRAAMAVSEQTTLDAGDQALLFNVFGGNDVAMNLYTSAGYTVLEESRSVDLPC